MLLVKILATYICILSPVKTVKTSSPNVFERLREKYEIYVCTPIYISCIYLSSFYYSICQRYCSSFFGLACVHTSQLLLNLDALHTSLGLHLILHLRTTLIRYLRQVLRRLSLLSITSACVPYSITIFFLFQNEATNRGQVVLLIAVTGFIL